MNTVTEFDKELERILRDFAKVVQLATLHPQVDGEVEDPEQAIKQAVDKYVIPVVVNDLDEIKNLNAHLDSTTYKTSVAEARGYIQAVGEARQSLWGKK